MKLIKPQRNPAKALERKPENINGKDVSGGKENCPSGYHCRTRHPKGPGYSYPPDRLKARGADLTDSQNAAVNGIRLL